MYNIFQFQLIQFFSFLSYFCRAMIRFFQEDTVFNISHKALYKEWLKHTALTENRSIGTINVIFCSDPYLLKINQEFLSHDYFTDIITFDYCEGSVLSGDLYISIDTVRENASFYNTSFTQELSRVIVHGLLHLIGYDDHTDSDIEVMRSKENYYLTLLPDCFND